MNIPLVRNGASAVVLADTENTEFPNITGLEEAAKFRNTDFKVFGKPTTRQYRRMAVALSYGPESTDELVKKGEHGSYSIKEGFQYAINTDEQEELVDSKFVYCKS